MFSVLTIASEQAAHAGELGDSGGAGVAHTIELTVALLSVAALVCVLAKFARVPYTLALVVAGLALAISGIAPDGARLTQDLVLLLFLPPLLFQAGLHLDLSHLKCVWVPVLLKAFPGVALTSFAVALAARPFLVNELGVDAATWQVALLFGVVLAPTDPISVLATFKTAGVPKRLKTLVEGESLFNDGTAVAFFAVLKTAVFAGGAVGLGAGEAIGDAAHTVPEAGLSIASVLIEFVRVAGLGTILGLALGLAAFALLRVLNDHTLETGITVALAWGSFILAESIHASGVIAVVVAGLIMGNYGKAFSMSRETRRTLTGFWDGVDFLINALLFLLIGFELSDPAVGGASRLLDPSVFGAAFAVLGAMFLARAVLVYPIARVFGRDWPTGWKHVVFWAGLRGSLSLALVLGLPTGELRIYLVPVAFLVVLLSLFGQGVTMPFLIRAVNMGDDDDTEDDDMENTHG